QQCRRWPGSASSHRSSWFIRYSAAPTAGLYARLVRIASLHVYPVKSTAGIGVESSEVRPEGLRDDRRWMVVDAVGHKLTARERHRLLHVHPEPDGAGGLKLTYRDESLPPLYVPRPD